MAASAPKGINRLLYFGLSIAATFFYIIISGVTGAPVLLEILFIFLFLLIAAYRIKNIGWNPWLSLVSLIPIANIAIMLPAFAFPPNYKNTKKLDVTAKVLIALFVLFLILPIVIIVALGMIGSQLNDSFTKVEQKLKQQERQYVPEQNIPSPTQYLAPQQQ